MTALSEAVEFRAPATGLPYEVRIGLPPVTADFGNGSTFHDVPFLPHVVPVDTFVLRESSRLHEPLLIAQSVSMLYMHGRRQRGSWVPSDPSLQDKGVTIPGIVEAFEEARPDKHIDVLFVCGSEETVAQSGLATRVRVRRQELAGPRIYVPRGQAYGRGISRNLVAGGDWVVAEMEVADRNDAQYLDWQAAREARPSRVKVQPVRA